MRAAMSGNQYGMKKSDVAGCPCRDALSSVQARRELRHRLHFALAHFGSDLSHHFAVDVLAVLVGATLPRLERLQLRQGVVGILAAHARISLRNACSIGGVTRGAGRQSAARIAAAENLLSGGNQLPIFRCRGFGFLLCEKESERARFFQM